MPEVKFYHPNDDIKWLVRKFEMIKSNHISLRLTDNFIPRPDVALVFNFRSIPVVLHPPDIRLKPLFIATIPVKPLQLYLQGEVDTFIVICKATVLSRVLRVDLNTNSVPVIELFNKQIMRLHRRFPEEPTSQGRINCFSEFLQDLMPDGYQPDIIDRVYNDILENGLKKPLEEITENVCCSVSSLQRNFLTRTGVSMKKLIRIARVHAIFEKMLKEKRFDSRDVLYESNYYDQSHFIKDFKEITGRSPKNFFNENSELCRMISGMESTLQQP